MSATISIALAAYNGERYLREQLDSLAVQTRLPDELVVSDDRSTDGTRQVVESFASRAPFPVRLVTNAGKQSHVDNTQNAVMHCTSHYVAKCDQDDVWKPNKVARVAEVFERDPSVVLVQHSAVLVDQDLRPLNAYRPRYPRDEVFEWLRSDPGATAPGIAQTFARWLVTVCAFEGRPMSLTQPYELDHDEWIPFIGFALGRVAQIKDPLLLYRRHGANVSHDPVARSAAEHLKGGDRGQYLAIAANFRARSDYLRKQKKGCRRTDQFLEGSAVYFERLARRWALRAAARDGARRRRLYSITKLALAGGYRPRTHGGLGARSLAKDMVISVR